VEHDVTISITVHGAAGITAGGTGAPSSEGGDAGGAPAPLELEQLGGQGAAGAADDAPAPSDDLGGGVAGAEQGANDEPPAPMSLSDLGVADDDGTDGEQPPAPEDVAEPPDE
jgi:hypothetical protein